MINFTTPKGFIIAQDDIDNILAACFEGCSNYWIEEQNPKIWPDTAEFASHTLTRGTDIDFTVEDEIKTLTLDMFLNGIDLFRDKFPGYDDSDSLACDADSDNILQFALFGELVYG